MSGKDNAVIGCNIAESEKGTGGRQIAALLFLVATVQIACYYLSGALVNGESPLAAPQPDTLLYCQAARRIAEGSPFSFSAGSGTTTGTTSVLYPFVLAIPYILGAKGDVLITAGFVLNSVFYLMFLFGWTLVFFSIFSRPHIRILAVLLLALSPQPAYSAMSQSDIGLWLATSGLFAASFFSSLIPAYAALLALGPWIRPEGMVLVLAFCIYAIYVRRKSDIFVALLGVVSSAGVFLLNISLSGRAQFSSVANKGHFKVFCIPEAICRTATDMMQILKGFVLGISDAPPRLFFIVPLLGAACIICGAAIHKWRDERGVKLGTLVIAAFGGFATVAMSGWQNTNMDRYLAWTFPLVAAFLAEGVVAICDKIVSSGIRKLLFLLPLVYAVLASIVMVAVFNGNSYDTSMKQDFARSCEQIMPQGASVGGLGFCGFAYEVSDRRFAHLCGIYSPEFRTNTPNPLPVIETLKHESQARFDYWLFLSQGDLGVEFSTAAGESAAVGPFGMELRRANWEIFDGAEKTQILGGDDRWQLVSRIDVGYEKDEDDARYRIEPRYGLRPFEPFLKLATAPDGGKEIVEVARMVAGLDEMSVALEPGIDAKVVMRTCLSCDTVSRGAFTSTRVKYEIANPARLNLAVDGRLVGEVTYACATNGFSDVEFNIPGSAITKSPCTVAFLGDHIACAYWFFQ